MASPKKRSRAVVTVVCALLVLCLAAALVFFGLAKRKLSALQAGADFDLIYGVTAQSSTAPALYSILEQAGATSGRVTGLYSPGQLQLYLYSSTARTTETSGDNFFTDIYIDADQTLFNAGQLYRTLRQSVASRYPLAGALLPDWTLGSYISQNQLAQVLAAAGEGNARGDGGFQRKPRLKKHSLKGQQRVLGQRREIHLLKDHFRLALVGSGPLQQVFYQTAHLVGHGEDAVHTAALILPVGHLQKLCVGHDDGEGCFQLVGSVGYKLPLLVPGLLHRADHPPCQQHRNAQKYP